MFLGKRLSPPNGRGRAGHDFALEGLRGLCALLVVYTHATLPEHVLDPKYSPGPLPFTYWGPPAVLIFFVISGYSIGLSVREEATRPAIASYVRRRLVRIVPIAWLGLLLARAFYAMPAKVFIANLLFLQNSQLYPFGISLPLAPGNPVLWSLSCEMIYYAAFVAVWRFRPRLGVVLAACAVLIAGGFLPYIWLGSWLVAHLADGFVFWIAGLWMAWVLDPAPNEQRVAWPSGLLAGLSLWTMAPFQAFCIAYFPRGIWDETTAFQRLDFVLGAGLVVLSVVRRAPRLQVTLVRLCFLLELAEAAWLVAHHAWSTNASVAFGCCLAGVLLTGWKPPIVALAAVAPLGAMSYAIYAIHAPILLGMLRVHWLGSGSLGTYLVRVVVLLAVLIPLSWFLERVLQPRLKGWMERLWPGRRPKTPNVTAGSPSLAPTSVDH